MIMTPSSIYFIISERLEDFRVVGNPGNVELYNDRLVPEGSKLYLNAVINIPVNADQAFGRIEVNIPGPYLTMCEVEVHTGKDLPHKNMVHACAL